MGMKYRPDEGDKDNYIGLELEFVCDIDVDDLIELADEYGCSDLIDITDDGTPFTDDDYEYDIEIRMLSKQQDLKKNLNKLGEFLSCGRFRVDTGVDRNCGTHIHLDMRNRNFQLCGAKLLRTHHILEEFAHTRRKNAEYYRRVDRRINKHDWNSRSNINLGCYEHLKTIEVRLLEGTFNFRKIYHWVQLLVSIIEANTDAVFAADRDSKESLFKCLPLTTVEKSILTRIHTDPNVHSESLRLAI